MLNFKKILIILTCLISLTISIATITFAKNKTDEMHKRNTQLALINNNADKINKQANTIIQHINNLYGIHEVKKLLEQYVHFRRQKNIYVCKKFLFLNKKFEEVVANYLGNIYDDVKLVENNNSISFFKTIGIHKKFFILFLIVTLLFMLFLHFDHISARIYLKLFENDNDNDKNIKSVFKIFTFFFFVLFFIIFSSILFSKEKIKKKSKLKIFEKYLENIRGAFLSSDFQYQLSLITQKMYPDQELNFMSFNDFCDEVDSFIEKITNHCIYFNRIKNDTFSLFWVFIARNFFSFIFGIIFLCITYFFCYLHINKLIEEKSFGSSSYELTEKEASQNVKPMNKILYLISMIIYFMINIIFLITRNVTDNIQLFLKNNYNSYCKELTNVNDSVIEICDILGSIVIKLDEKLIITKKSNAKQQ